MSLRLIFKLFIALLVAAAVLMLARIWLHGAAEPTSTLNPEYRDLKAIAQVTRGTVVRAGGAAVEFVLPASASAVRILTNPGLRDIEAARRDAKANRDRRWQYALEVEEIRADGARTKRVHAFRRTLAEVTLPGGGGGSGSFYLEKDAPVPMASAPLRLDFAGGAWPERLRIRLLSADPDIADVLLRLATPEPLSQRAAETAWRRLSDEQRTRLAAGNLYPADLLDEQERANLMASRWRPVGPSGAVEGRDIHVLDTQERGAPIEPQRPLVLRTGADRVAVVQLPENGGRVRIELEPIEPLEPGAAASSDKVTIRWAGHSAFQRTASTRAWANGVFTHEAAFGGGWLEIASGRPAAVRVRLLTRAAAEGTDITPPVRLQRAWVVEGATALELPISHVAGLATPLRLVLRRIGPQDGLPAGTPVRVALLGAHGRVLHQLRVEMRAATLALHWSRHDGLWPELPGTRVSEPVEAFFRLPPQVVRVRISADAAVVANSYSRPPDLARAVRTPEDTISPDAALTAIPAWFALQPDDAEARILNSQTRLVTFQDRLPDDRPDLPAGDYTWESFTPVNDGAGRVFLAPREEGVPERIEGLAGTYRPLPASGGVDLVAEPGRSNVPVRLAWAADSVRTFTYAVSLDGQAWSAGAASGIAGEIALPAVSAGAHRLQVSANAPVSWFANHLQTGTPWVKRLAFRFDKPLQFDVERTTSEPEFLSVRLFRPAGKVSRMRVRVAIEAPASTNQIGPFPGWLFSQRVHNVRPSGQFALPVAESAGETSDAGQPFFVPLPKGAPLGRYRVTLSPEGGSGWIAASRITPGLAPKPKLIMESTRNGE